MPTNSKNTSARSGAGSSSEGARKPGSRSPKHRGFRPEEGTDTRAGAGRPRWTADDRARRAASSDRGGAARGTDRPAEQGRGYDRTERADRGDRTEQAGGRPTRRPDWEPRERTPRAGGFRGRDDRSPRDDRGAREYRVDRAPRGERPARDDRPQRTDRPDRAPRRDWEDRAPRDARTDRRPSETRGDRVERPARDDRFEGRPRGDRFERPARGEDRYERPARGDRYERPAQSDRFERPARSDRFERPSRGDRYERPARGDRFERPVRRDDRDERPARSSGDSRYYPTATARPFDAREDVVLDRLEAAAVTAEDVDGVTFGDLGLGGNIVRQLAALGAEAPFPIQAATIPPVLEGRDVLGRGRTGSGKTIAFGAPLVERLLRDHAETRDTDHTSGRAARRTQGRAPRALILAPTRELAQQIDRTVQPIARSVGLFTVTIVGGVPQHSQVTGLQRGVDIVIGTPGRIEDLVEQGRLDLSHVIVSVLDEADHMCDLGFLEPVQRILRLTRPGGQKLLFSATLDTGVAALVDEFLVEPSVHEVAGEDQASSTIEHRLLLIDQRDKRQIIEELVSGENRTIVFTRTRAFAEELTEHLEDAGIPATSLHGDLTQSRRTRSLQRLTSGRVDVLVATDVAARGIHVDDVSLVIQADAPEEYKTYLHRSGRTGRAGKPGTVVTLVNKQRRRRIDELLGRAEIEPIVDHVAPGDDLLAELASR